MYILLVVHLGGGVPRGGAVEHERLNHGLVGQPLDARGVEHFGRFAARDVGVCVPPLHTFLPTNVFDLIIAKP
jgi:hypothetical protein